MNFFSKFSLNIPVRRRTLSWKLPEGKGGRYPLKTSSFTVGRQAPNDMVIEHESISRRHARLSLEYDQLYVEDMASTRGTWIGGERIRPYTRTLVPPDTSLWIGQVELTFEKVDAVRVSILPVLLIFMLGICCGVPLLILKSLPVKSENLVCDLADSYLISIPQEKSQEVAQTPLEATATLSGTVPITSTPALTGTATMFPTETVPQLPSDTALYDSNIQAYTTPYFLELPIPYTGRNTFGVSQDEFETASQSVYSGGRITSFFDHDMPIYPFYNDGNETQDQSKYLLLFNGQQVKDRDTWKDGYFYSGHPAYDFSGSASTPIFAAATGDIVEVRNSGCEGNLIKIEHSVQNAGNFQTLYFHLQDDKVFQDWLKKFQDGGGQKITVVEGTMIGTMGTTGCSTGVHLHFEVRYDKNKDGHFDSGEVVDPYGFIPSLEYPKDLWSTTSTYLWRHPLGTTFTHTRGGGTTGLNKTVAPELEPISRTQPELCVPQTIISPDGPVYFSLSLSPPPAKGLVNIAQAVTFIILDFQQEVVPQYEDKILVSIPYRDADLKNIVPGSLSIRRLNAEENVWENVTTKFDTTNKIAAATVDKPGQYALFGELTPDNVPPTTTITLKGMINTEETAWCDAVEVTLSSLDERGPIKDLSYRLRDDLAWIQSPSPLQIFTLQPSPGNFNIQAIAIDQSDNPETPPAALSLIMSPTSLSACHPKEISSVPSPQPSSSNTLIYYLIPLGIVGVFVWFFIQRSRTRK